jgi:hypothetical protein
MHRHILKSSNGFPQRKNGDGSYDSICPHCFLTVAKGRTRRELDLQERAHACSPIDLAMIHAAKDELHADSSMLEE